MKAGSGFVAFFPSFSFGEDALLLCCEYDAIDWLIWQFDRLANTSLGSQGPSFVIGDGEPVESDGCLIVVGASNQLEGSQLVRKSDGSFSWSVSRTAAHRYRELLSSMFVSEPGHQYLDADNMASAPVVIISRGEYSHEWLTDAVVKL